MRILMDWGNPLRLIAPTVDVDVLHVLGRVHTGVTGNQLAHLAGRSYAQVSAVVDRLAEHGIVDVEQVGRTYSYRLNREHVGASAVVELLGAAQRVEDEIASMVANWELSPMLVALFGSAARREGNAASDIDLLVIRPDDVPEDDLTWTGQVAMLTDLVEQAAGNRVQLVELTRDELVEADLSGQPLVESLRREARTLFGDDLERLLAARRAGGAK